jgi:hypothetical protein
VRVTGDVAEHSSGQASDDCRNEQQHVPVAEATDIVWIFGSVKIGVWIVILSERHSAR